MLRNLVLVLQDSALGEYIHPGALMTHINDMSLGALGASEDPWIALLRNLRTEASNGWCVNLALCKGMIP